MTTRRSHAAGRKGDDRPTSNQRKEFRAQLARGQITKATLQSLLLGRDNPTLVIEPDVIPRRLKMEVIKEWDRWLLANGPNIFEFLQPFYAPSFRFRLRPALPDLFERARPAIFWRDLTGVSVVTTPTLVWYREIEHLAESIDQTFGLEKLDSETIQRFGFALGSLWHERELYHQLRDCLAEHVGKKLSEWIPSNLWSCLFFGLLNRFSFDENVDFRYVLWLWRQGNFPLGFDSSNNLVVLCAAS